jgi:hypothetical protein
VVGAEEAVAGAVEGETAEEEVLVVATVVIAKARQADNNIR